MPPSVRDWVPEGHLVWTVLDAVGEWICRRFTALLLFPWVEVRAE